MAQQYGMPWTRYGRREQLQYPMPIRRLTANTLGQNNPSLTVIKLLDVFPGIAQPLQHRHVFPLPLLKMSMVFLRNGQPHRIQQLTSKKFCPID